MSFKTKLLLFALTLIAILAIPFLLIEIQLPWKALYGLINQSEARLGSLEVAFEPEELRRINQYALEMIERFGREATPDGSQKSNPSQACSQAFSMLVTHQRLMSENRVRAVFKENGLELEQGHYESLKKWYQFWQAEFDRRPGLEGIFYKYRGMLLKVHAHAVNSGFKVANLYLMLDAGQADFGFFKENVAFILESIPWWESNYLGEPYNLAETNTLSWRQSYDRKSGGQPGFYHNKVLDPDRWYLPQFDTDQWGTWFSAWIALQVDLGQGRQVYNTLNIDFDAAEIEGAMLKAAIKILVITAILTLMLVLATRRFSQWLTRPISALIEGAEAVIAQDYDHVVPTFGNDEFNRLIEVFNRMIRWLQERLNLKDTLTKLLSDELAEKAAQEGLVLGGQEMECTLMFTDFAGFSTLTRTMSAANAVQILNSYFGQLIPIIKKWGGFPDKYIGDAIVVIFGAPVKLEDHAERAVRCAIELQKTLRQINDRWRREGKVVFEMRLGLNSGIVVAGAIGCEMKLEYTSIGETTNLANRMESQCKIGHVLMTENTFDRIKDKRFHGVYINQTSVKETVKGYVEPISTYGIYVNDLKILKDMTASDPSRFYLYETVLREA